MRLIRLNETSPEEILAATDIVNKPVEEVIDDFYNNYKGFYSRFYPITKSRLIGNSTDTSLFGNSVLTYHFVVLSEARDTSSVLSFDLGYYLPNKKSYLSKDPDIVLANLGVFSVQIDNESDTTTINSLPGDDANSKWEISRTYDNNGRKEIFNQVQRVIRKVYSSANGDFIYPTKYRILKSLIKELDDTYDLISYRSPKNFS